MNCGFTKWIFVCAMLGCSWLTQASQWTGEVVTLEPKPGEERVPVITALAIHPSGHYVALGGDDHLVRIWDLREHRVATILDGHTDWVRTLSYSPTGDLLVSSGNDHHVVVWNTETGEKRREYSQLSHVVTSVVFSHDGNLVAVVGFGDKLRIIDGKTGDLLREYSCPTSDMRSVIFSPDDEIIVGGGRNGKVRLWNSVDGGILSEFTAHSQRIRDIAISPDGLSIATCGEDRKIVISNTVGGQAFELPRQSAKVMTLVFCGMNELATGGSDNTVHIWDLATRRQVEALEGHTGTVAVLAYHNDVLVSSGFDASVRVWTRNTRVDRGLPVGPGRTGLRRTDLKSR
jgi:WD40 repeat protein